MVDVTPHKNRDIDCFVCFSTNVTSYTLCGRKLMNENFQDKLISLLAESSTYEKLTQKDAAVCRNCYNQINKINSFLEKLSHSCETFLNASNSLKRCALSPLTPKSVNVNTKSQPVKRKSWKQLKLLASPEEKLVKDVNIGSPTLINVDENHTESATLDRDLCTAASIPDHAYFKPKPTVKPDVNHDILETIKERSMKYVDGVTGDILKDIKSQAATLTSRTTMLASVLYKHRGISELADNTENLLVDIVKEMQERYI